MRSVREIQRALADRGFNPGPADGVRGRLTIAAIKRFQAANGLKPDGIVGPETTRVLFPETQNQPIPVGRSPDAHPWLDLARRKMGLHEVRDNSILRAFLKLGKGTIGDPAKIPWCGDFVETCIAVALPGEPLPANPYAAINWLNFGRPVSPRPGAILVFWRGSPDGWQGHVGFYVAENATHYHVLGGNQSNAVTITRIARNRLRPGGSRWPLTAMTPGGATPPVYADGTGLDVTTNEA